MHSQTIRPLALSLVQSPSTEQRLARDFALVVGGSLLIALTAQVEFPLPFTPVPVTGQTFGVLICGAALGSRRGLAATALYLLEGAIGLPFFAGGAFGWARLLGPTGGYLLGFLLAAYFSGKVAERAKDRTVATAIPAFLVAQLCIYGVGMPWLGFLTGFDGIWMKGFLPFIPGLIVKSVAAGLVLPAAWKRLS